MDTHSNAPLWRRVLFWVAAAVITAGVLIWRGVRKLWRRVRGQ